MVPQGSCYCLRLPPVGPTNQRPAFWVKLGESGIAIYLYTLNLPSLQFFSVWSSLVKPLRVPPPPPPPSPPPRRWRQADLRYRGKGGGGGGGKGRHGSWSVGAQLESACTLIHMLGQKAHEILHLRKKHSRHDKTRNLVLSQN